MSFTVPLVGIMWAQLGVSLWCCVVWGGMLWAQQRQWNWEKLTLPPPYDRGFYLDVMFLQTNPQYGWACGFGGYVLRTTDGGATWEGTTIPNADQLESIIFVNERVGYCSGTNNGNPNLGGIYKSIDGGRSWQEITPAIMVNGVLQRAPVWGCYFLDENTGMVVGGGCEGWAQLFFRTTDGGQTWSLFTANESQTGMSHVLMYDANGLCYASSSGRIWRSLDGGRTWQVYAVTGPAFWQENLANRGNTFLVATAGNTCTGSTGPIGDIRWSYDGGRTWSRYETGASMFGTFLVDEDEGWAVGWNRAVYLVARNRVSGEVTVMPYRCGLEPGSNYDDVWFVNDTLGYLVGDGIYRTTMRDLLQPIIISNTGRFVVCDGQPIILSVVKGDRIRQPYSEYLWSTGERTPAIVVSKAGTYWVEVRDADACYGKAAAVEILEAPSPTVNVRLLTRPIVCEGDTIIVEAVIDSSAVGVAEFWWVDRQERTTRLVIVADGTQWSYGFKAMVRGVNGCEAASQVVDVVVWPRLKPTVSVLKPLVARSDGSLVLCPGDEVELRASDGFDEYQWNTGQTTQSIIIREAGTYTVTVWNHVIDGLCSGTSAPITIVIGDTVKPMVLSERGFRFCDGDRITLRTDRSYRQYRWSNGAQSPTITIGQAGQYWVEVTDEYNCTGRSDPIQVEVDPNPIEVLDIIGSMWRFDTTAATMMRCDSIRVRNSGNVPLVLPTARLQRNIEFSVPLAQLPIVIQPGQERWIIACYMPTSLGEQRDTLHLSDNADYCKRDLIVIGVCSANNYATISRCDVSVQGTTVTFNHAGLLVVPPYPNPATDEVHLVVKAAGAVGELVHHIGSESCQCLSLRRSDGYSELRCPTTRLPSGAYVVLVRVGAQVLSVPVIVAR